LIHVRVDKPAEIVVIGVVVDMPVPMIDVPAVRVLRCVLVRSVPMGNVGMRVDVGDVLVRRIAVSDVHVPGQVVVIDVRIHMPISVIGVP